MNQQQGVLPEVKAMSSKKPFTNADLVDQMRNSLISLKIKKAMEAFGDSISNAAGFKVEATIYEGVGLNDHKSIFCDFTGKDLPFRLYLEFITGPGQELDLFIVDFNIPAALRCQGLGSRIICGLLGHISQFRMGKILLNPASKRATQFWLKFGFRQISGPGSMSLSLANNEYTARCAYMLLRSLTEMTA
jgi:hypothetical protein